MSTPQAAYDELTRRSRQRALLGSCEALLGWDEQTYLPRQASPHRGDQVGLLAGMIHEQASDPVVGELIATVEGSNLVQDPNPALAANIREWRRGFDRATKLPRTLVEELARTTSIAQQEWVVARKASDFGHFAPWLGSIVDLKRQEANCLGNGHATPYDALLDDYEPGANVHDLTQLFATLRAELVPLVAAIVATGRTPRPLLGDYPVEAQRIFGETVAAAVGFDFDRGRLDTAAHPFCSGLGPHDCRITTRFDPRDFTDGFFSILHEVGHALYEQGLNTEVHGTPVGEAASLGIHESQSRLWENAVGRGRPFWSHWLPQARRIFRNALGDVDLDHFLASINQVQPSLIRVQADEVTYNLHIVIRFELENALIAGDLAISDLPAAWNERYRTDLGITPPDDAQGCLQDIHWAAGLFGYFPTYTLGNLYAAQLYDKARRELSGFDDRIAAGDCAPLLGWLRERIHRFGKTYPPRTLIQAATGLDPEPTPLIQSLKAKYGELYHL